MMQMTWSSAGAVMHRDSTGRTATSAGGAGAPHPHSADLLGSVRDPPGPGGFEWGPEKDTPGKELTALGNGATAPAALAPSLLQTTWATCAPNDVDSIVVGPSSAQDQEAQFFTELTGEPGVPNGGVVVWLDVHP